MLPTQIVVLISMSHVVAVGVRVHSLLNKIKSPERRRPHPTKGTPTTLTLSLRESSFHTATGMLLRPTGDRGLETSLWLWPDAIEDEQLNCRSESGPSSAFGAM
jgi:hypothetical protein